MNKSLANKLDIGHAADLLPCQKFKQNPKKAKVILRIDNVQAFGFKEAVWQMMEDAAKREIKPVIGVIPTKLKGDGELVRLIKRNGCNIEVAQQSLTMEKATILSDKETLENLTGLNIQTIIPPSDSSKDNLNPFLLENGYKFVSKIGGDYLNVNLDSYYNKDQIFMPVNKTLEQCSQQILISNLCIISVHPQNFYEGKKFNQDYYQSYYLNILDEIKSQGLEFVSFEDLKDTKGIVNSSKYSGWISDFDSGEGIESVKIAKTKLQSISPVWFEISNAGVMNIIHSKYPKNVLVKILKEQKIQLLPSVTNQFDSKRTKIFLNSPKLQDNFIEKSINLALKENYVGFDLDWEQVDPEDKDKFTVFIFNFAKKMHDNKLMLSLSVHAKTGTAKDWTFSQSQDWVSLKDPVDHFRIMAYDYHNENSQPGAIAPIKEVEEVLKYAVALLPKEKIILGLATYGYDWTEKGGKPLQYMDATDLTRKYETLGIRDLETGSLYAKYTEENGVKHTIWYEDFISTAQKVALARKMGVYQFSFWRLGKEDQNIWN